MGNTHILILVTAAAVASTSAFAADSTGAAPQPGHVISVRPVPTDSMERLKAAAQELRESIQALAQKPPGPERKVAIAEAHEALLQTQAAMVALPPDLRSTGTVSVGDYDTSVRKLMAAADSLRDAVQEMAQQPAGSRRNDAIRRANRALLDTQSAMVNAYEPGSDTAKAGK